MDYFLCLAPRKKVFPYGVATLLKISHLSWPKIYQLELIHLVKYFIHWIFLILNHIQFANILFNNILMWINFEKIKAMRHGTEGRVRKIVIPKYTPCCLVIHQCTNQYSQGQVLYYIWTLLSPLVLHSSPPSF